VTAGVQVVTCTLLREQVPKAVVHRKTSVWATEDCCSKEDERPGLLVHLDILLGRSLLGRAPSGGAACTGQIRLLRAVVLVVQVEEVAEVQVQASDQSEQGNLHLENLEDAVFVPCRLCWSCLYFAGAGELAHMAAAVATLTAILTARAGLEEFLWMRRGRSEYFLFPFGVGLSNSTAMSEASSVRLSNLV